MIKDTGIEEVLCSGTGRGFRGDTQVFYQVYGLYFGGISWTHELRAAFAYSSVNKAALD